jgi:hypothetical protein
MVEEHVAQSLEGSAVDIVLEARQRRLAGGLRIGERSATSSEETYSLV